LDYTYGVLDDGELDERKNNGNVESQTITVSGKTFVQSYVYDSVNRLGGVTEKLNGKAIWTQNYGFDRWGNRTSLVNSGGTGQYLPTQSTPAVDSASNRLLDYSYDEVGNLTVMPAGVYMTYDGENRQALFGGYDVRYVYGYDGDGRRVKKINEDGGPEIIVFVYNAAGRMVAEYSSITETLPNVKVSYLTADHLSSTRVVTDATGAVVARHDYMPYGEEIPILVERIGIAGYGAADGIRQKFTQKERDNESGLDYFLARYYSSAQGRFTSVDNPRYAKATDPQTWNLYAYVRNGPLNKIDPDGRNWFRIGDHYEWHEGNKYTYKDSKGKTHTVRSNFTHLLVFERTGTNSQGAATGTLKLYEQNKVIATANAFSGGNRNVEIPPGNFMIRLDIRGKADSLEAVKPNGRELKQFYGIQEIAPWIPGSGNHRWEWGSVRAALNEEPGEKRPEYQGNYLHGKQRPGDYTHGCICNRDEHILNILLGLDYKQVPKVPVVVR